jgi:PPOX class probable F420-dependent enzyme
MLATNGHDGVPQVTALWFVHDKGSDEIKFSLNDGRQKVKNLRRDPHATLFILDPANPYRAIEIRGQVELEADPDYSFVPEVKAKYGQDVRDFDQADDTRSVGVLHASKVTTTLMG